MKKHIYEVTISSAKDGSLKIKKFPIEEGTYKAIKSLPTLEEQVKYFTQEYRLYKKEQNYKVHHLADSLESEDPEIGLAHQVADTALTPAEYYSKKEQDELIWTAISHLTKRQRIIVISVFYKGISQKKLAKFLGVSKQAISNSLVSALAKLRKELEEKN